MNIQNGAYALTGPAWPNSAARYLFNPAPSDSDQVLMLEALLWT